MIIPNTIDIDFVDYGQTDTDDRVSGLSSDPNIWRVFWENPKKKTNNKGGKSGAFLYKCWVIFNKNVP